MSEHENVVEQYLDDLLTGLRGDAAAVRRMLTETEEHLYAAVDDGVARGLRREDAAIEAVARFGPAPQVAKAWTSNAPQEHVARLARRLSGQLAPLVGVGLVSIGISGLLARLMSSLWGLTFMFADPPGTTYSIANCRYWLSIHPHATSCTNAYLAESLADGLQARYAAGVVGLVVLAVIATRRRRRGLPVISAPPQTIAIAGATVFLAASIALAAMGIDAIRISQSHGAGQWLSGAFIAFPIAVGYAIVLFRRPPALATL